MQVSIKEARIDKLEVWFAMYDKNTRIMPQKINKISKKFIYFNETDKIGVWNVNDYFEKSAGLFTTEYEAWRFVMLKCQSNLEYAKSIIRDYEMIINTHPESLI